MTIQYYLGLTAIIAEILQGSGRPERNPPLGQEKALSHAVREDAMYGTQLSTLAGYWDNAVAKFPNSPAAIYDALC